MWLLGGDPPNPPKSPKANEAPIIIYMYKYPKKNFYVKTKTITISHEPLVGFK